MNFPWKICPFCHKYVIESQYVGHVKAVHISPSAENDKILTTDDSGKIISLKEYAEIHGDVRSSEISEKRGINIKPFRQGHQENIFQKIAHIKEKHQPRHKGPLKIECRYCHQFIEKDKIGKHNLLKHPHELPVETGQQKRLLRPNSKEDNDDVILVPEGEEGNIAEKLKQALDESRYGFKGMHHRHEWDGKFGSTPLHDDYSDESDSD